MGRAYYFGGFKLEPLPDTMTLEQATALTLISPSYRQYELFNLKRNARIYLAQGMLNRAINQTRLALLTYREINK